MITLVEALQNLICPSHTVHIVEFSRHNVIRGGGDRFDPNEKSSSCSKWGPLFS